VPFCRGCNNYGYCATGVDDSTDGGDLYRIADVSSEYAVDKASDKWCLFDRSQRDTKCGGGEMENPTREGFTWALGDCVYLYPHLSDGARGRVTYGDFRGERRTDGRREGGGLGEAGSERHRVAGGQRKGESRRDCINTRKLKSILIAHLYKININTQASTRPHDKPHIIMPPHPPNPKISATLIILIRAPHNPTKIATKSTTSNDDAPSMKRGLKILYSMRCLLKCPAHIVVARLIVA
jgi:hypothetical protein